MYIVVYDLQKPDYGAICCCHHLVHIILADWHIIPLYITKLRLTSQQATQLTKPNQHNMSAEHDLTSAYLEKLLQQMPVALLALNAGHIFKRVHLDVVREVL